MPGVKVVIEIGRGLLLNFERLDLLLLHLVDALNHIFDLDLMLYNISERSWTQARMAMDLPKGERNPGPSFLAGH